MADRRLAVGENGEMARRFAQAGELQRGITGRQIAVIGAERLGVAGFEIVQHRLTAPGILDEDEAPGLAEANRGRQARDLDQPLQRARRQRVSAKAADIATPAKQIEQARPKRVVELRRR